MASEDAVTSALTDRDRLGTTIGDGKYTLERVLGCGGMGTVFEAVHRWTGRHVALKLLQSEAALDIEASHRFLQEARYATAIEHPNVVEVLDMGRDDESSAYMVFELLRGESLADRLEAHGPLDAMQAAMILLPIADALAAAHRLGIVHRDVKPENIFLEDDGMGYVRPKLLDFGIACASERESGADLRVVMGTPGYLSPEQAQGLHAGPASDVWSLCVVLFECLSGSCPFESESLAGALAAIALHPAPSLRQVLTVPEPIADLVERTLVWDPAVRLPDGAEFRDALAAASQVEFVPSRSRSVPPKIVRGAKEFSLSSAHRVEVRQSTPTLLPMPPVPRPTPVPAGPTTPRSVPVTIVREVVSRRVDSAPAAEGAPAANDLDTLSGLASLPLLLPQPGRFWRRARFAAAVLLLLLVPIVMFTHPTQAAGPREVAGLVTNAVAGSAAGASSTGREAAAHRDAPSGSSSASLTAPAQVARSAEPSLVPPSSAARRRAAASHDDYLYIPPDEVAEPVDAIPELIGAVTELVGPDTEPVDATAEPADPGTVPADPIRELVDPVPNLIDPYDGTTPTPP